MMESIDPYEQGLEDTRHQLAKLVLGSAAGFLAGKVAEKMYNCAIVAYRQRKAAG
jgi:hypothetical protein